MKTGIINLFFENSNILSKNKIFNLKDYASIEVSDYEYLDDNDQILQMKVKIKIFDSVKFNRFLFNYNKDKIKKKNLYLTYRFNVNTKVSFISRISFTGYNKETEFYQFKNLQQLKNLLKDDNIYN